MPAETFQEFKEFYESNAESEDMLEFRAQFETTRDLDKDTVLSFLDNEGLSIKQSLVDRSNQEAIEKWKESHLKETVESELLKLNPPKTDAEKRLVELEKKLELADAEKLKERLLNNTIKEFTESEKGFGKYAPILAELALSGSEEATKQKAELLRKTLDSYAAERVANDIAGRSRRPEGSSTPNPGAASEIKKLEEAVKNGEHGALQRLNYLRRVEALNPTN